MLNETKKHISSPSNPLAKLQTIITSQGSIEEEARGEVLGGKHIVGFAHSFLRSNDHNSLIGMPTGSLCFSMLCRWIVSRKYMMLCLFLYFMGTYTLLLEVKVKV